MEIHSSLTRSAVVAHSPSALGSCIEFYYRPVLITAHELQTTVTEKGALKMPLQSSDPKEPLQLRHIIIFRNASRIPRLHGRRWLSKHQTYSGLSRKPAFGS